MAEQRFLFIRNLTLENRCWATCYQPNMYSSSETQHRKTNVTHVFFHSNSTSEMWCWAYMFISLEMKRQKTDVKRTCFFHRESDVGKPMSSQCVFSIGNLTSGQHFFFIGKTTSQNRCLANMIFLIGSLTPENWSLANAFFELEIRRQKMDDDQTCYFHWKPKAGKPTWGNIFFSLELWRQKTDI